MSKKIKSLFTYLTSLIAKGESSPKNEQKPQHTPEKTFLVAIIRSSIALCG